VAARKKTCLAGHEGCEKCNLHCCAITPERAAEIAAQARSGTNWAEVVNYGGACICGHRSKAPCGRHPRKEQT
jgi:hypothetical protein